MRFNREQVTELLKKGLIWSIPAILSIWIVTVVFGIADKILGVFTRAFLYWFVPEFLHVGPFAGGESPLLSFIFLMVLLVIVGAFVSWRFGETIVRAFESLVVRTPGIGIVYRSARTVAEFFDSKKTTPFQRVVLIPYPHPGVFVKAFVSGTTKIKFKDGNEQTFLKVVVPNPPTGIQGIVLVPEKDAIDLPMTVAEGIQFYVSLGMVAPSEMDLTKPIEPASDTTA